MKLLRSSPSRSAVGARARSGARLWAETFTFDSDGPELVLFELCIVGAQLSGFTRAESQVIDLMLLGHSSVEIARLRGVSRRTVANQLASIYAKLEVASRSELIAALTQPERPST